MKIQLDQKLARVERPSKFYVLRTSLYLWSLRIRGKLRFRKKLDWFHRRFRIRRFDGSPWHGLSKFNASTAANILFASGKKRSFFADLVDRSPGVAENFIAEAFTGASWQQVLKRNGFFIEHCPVEIALAAREAVEVYSPKP